MLETDRRAAAAVTLLPALLWLLCWPFSGLGVNDDFGYSFIVRRLLETGAFTYNGWSSPILGVQALWGALFAGAFGFSNDVLRISTLPLAMACAAMTYALHRRVGVPVRWAAFSTLALTTSPLFTPLSTSFMTDVPGLTLTLTIFHLAVSMARAPTLGRAALFAWLIALVGTLGGTVRQTNFVIAAVAIAVELWRRRRERPWAMAGALLVHLACTYAATKWYARQPYSTLDSIPRLGQGPKAVRTMFFFGLSFVLFTLPMVIACLRLERFRPALRAAIGAACLAVCAAAVWLVPPQADRPHVGQVFWSLNTVTPTGLLPDGVDAPGERSTLFPVAARVAIAACVYTAIALAAVAAFRNRAAIAGTVRRLILESSGTHAAAVALLLAIGCVYLCLLVPRAASGLAFDRYLLPIIPIATVAFLFTARARLATVSPGPVAYALLAVYAAGGVALTNDHFAELRMRDQIGADFKAVGVARERLSNGLAFDAWTQFEAVGYVNDSRIVKPVGAYVPDPRSEAREALFWFLPRTPVVQPEWIALNAPARPAETLAGERVYSYRTILRPWSAWIVVRPVDPSEGVTFPTTRPAPTP